MNGTANVYKRNIEWITEKAIAYIILHMTVQIIYL